MKNENADRKQYVMCHELGRSFGFLNKNNNNSDINTQTCMDVTEEYSSHRSPGISQFSMLAKVYGIVDGTREQSSNDQQISYRSSTESDHELKMKNATAQANDGNKRHDYHSGRSIAYVKSILYH